MTIVKGQAGKNLDCQLIFPDLFIDAHMHIQSGRCTPLPVLWVQNSMVRAMRLSRKSIEGAVPVLKSNLSQIMNIQKKTTHQIGKIAVSQLAANLNYALGSYTVNQQKKTLLGIMAVLPMDMEYAHKDGYNGQTIYSIGMVDDYVYTRFGAHKVGSHEAVLSGGLEVPGESFYSYDDNPKGTFDDWEIQLFQTELSAVENPWQLLSMYHFDPRRMIGNASEYTSIIDSMVTATPYTAGFFLGFKMYPSLGYQPLDQHVNIKGILENHYSQCESKEIPIITHCSNGGIFAIDWPSYYSQDNKLKATDLDDYTLSHYIKQHIHPGAWKKVLEKYPKLKLCLAHFGGELWEYLEFPRSRLSKKEKELFIKKQALAKDWIGTIIELINSYDNLYVDISYWVIQGFRDDLRDVTDRGPNLEKTWLANRKLLDRLLFGTDWYLTEMDQIGYSDFSRKMKPHLDQMSYRLNLADGISPTDPKKWDLWKKFTLDNPMKFFGLDNEDKIDNIKIGIDEMINDIAINGLFNPSDKADFNKYKKNYLNQNTNNHNTVKSVQLKFES